MTGPANLTVPAPQADQERERSVLARLQLTHWDAFAVLLTTVLVIAFAPPLMFRNWTPRMAVALAAGPVGLYLLGRLVRRRDLPALLLTAALAWSVVVAATSDAPRSALLGFAGRDLSTLTVALAGGFWAIGRQVSARGARALTIALTWSAAFVAVVGAAQVILNVDTGALALFDGRPTGLLTNPVYFGAVCAAALIAAADECARGAWREFVAPLVMLGVGTSISGSRVALGAVCLAMIVYCAVHRAKQTFLTAGAVAGSLALGVLLDRAVGLGRNAASRLGESSGGRTAAWRYGLESWLDQPLTGNGLGRFRAAVQHRFSADFVRDYAPDEATQAWFDAHNLVVGLLVAVGVIGVVLFAVWAGTWARTIRGPLAWALIPVAAHWMLQPVSLFTLPLAMLAFGAAGTRRTARPRADKRVAVALLALGLGLAAGLVAADAMLRRATRDFDGDRAAAVARVFGSDPIVGDIVAQVYASDPDATAAVLDWRMNVVEAEPDRPHWWSALARVQTEAGLFVEAEASLQHAYDLQPNNLRTIRTEGRLAIAQRNEPRLREVLDKLCALDQPECELDASDLLSDTAADIAP